MRGNFLKMVCLNECNGINLIRNRLIKFTNLYCTLNSVMVGSKPGQERRRVGRGTSSPTPKNTVATETTTEKTTSNDQWDDPGRAYEAGKPESSFPQDCQKGWNMHGM